MGYPRIASMSGLYPSKLLAEFLPSGWKMLCIDFFAKCKEIQGSFAFDDLKLLKLDF